MERTSKETEGEKNQREFILQKGTTVGHLSQRTLELSHLNSEAAWVSTCQPHQSLVQMLKKMLIFWHSWSAGEAEKWASAGKEIYQQGNAGSAS